ncbi:zeta toxin family protein (plasmid) [Pseudomonas sp. B21128]|jgi:predicted kinase|uniref:Toxin n=2 Tax=Pseudomonas TaxID=286 RepID=A0A2T0HJA6_PSEFL|nr:MULTISPECIES: zeta toxin family protein [Pseudomonas]MBJ2248907.1 zeta toxin family protein [Pseudomonas haemolytica]MBK3484699.1 zeta toxin family protein [Pseudomonas fluorescens]PRW83162.1 toxin [Pseudomonas fluorescens]
MDDQSKGLSVKEAQAVVDRFLADYNGNIPLRNLVRANQEDIYGPQASREKIGIRIDGAYHPGSGLITIVASNMGDEGAIVRTLRHELLGHFGLNTFDPEEKRALLSRVLETRNESTLSHIWAYVDKNYADKSELFRAEEVFAFVAEDERTFLGRAWDRTRAALQQVLKATGLIDDKSLSIHELRVEALAIAKGIKSGERHQQTFPKDDQSQFRLEAEEHQLIFEDIAQHALMLSKPVQQPVAIILGGQPGAGKAALSSYATTELGGNSIKIDADELRKYHPHLLKLMRENDRDAADLTHRDAAGWAVKLTNLAIKERRNLVIDGTMRDPDSLAKLCSKLQSAGYRIDARVLAVNDLVSRLSIHHRYELQHEANGFGRWSNRTNHDLAFVGLPLTVDRLETANLVDRMHVTNRSGTDIYDNTRIAGGWQQTPVQGRVHVDAERSRAWTQAERSSFELTLDLVQSKMHRRQASEGDLAELAAIRADYNRTLAPSIRTNLPNQIKPR